MDIFDGLNWVALALVLVIAILFSGLRIAQEYQRGVL